MHSFDDAGPRASHDYLSVRTRPVIVRTDPRNTCDTTPCTSAPPALTQSAASASLRLDEDRGAHLHVSETLGKVRVTYKSALSHRSSPPISPPPLPPFNTIPCRARGTPLSVVLVPVCLSPSSCPLLLDLCLTWPHRPTPPPHHRLSTLASHNTHQQRYLVSGTPQLPRPKPTLGSPPHVLATTTGVL